ncbi:MAG: GDSL-type esterase/lipase family protein [Nitrolancea sp.]
MTNFLGRRTAMIVVLLALLGGAGFAWWSSRDQGVAAERPVYAALGASDAVGVGADNPSSEGWVPLIARDLPGNPDLLNLGISGATLNDVINEELPVALDAHPSWLSIWPGVNDLRHQVSLRAFNTQLNALLDRINHDTQTRVIVLNIPDLRDVPAFASLDPQTLDETVRLWNAVIAQAAQLHNAILVDLYSNSEIVNGHPEDISSDGFHPSTAGYKRIADLVLKTVHDHVQPSP